MKKTYKNLLLTAGALGLTQMFGLAAFAQSSVATTNADPDFLAPASATAVAAAAGAAQAQAGAGAATGTYQNTSAATGAYEQHYQVQNPTLRQNTNLGLHPTGFGGIAPVFGY